VANLEQPQVSIPEAALAAVRRRGAFLTTTLIWVIVIGVAIASAGYFIIIANAALDAGESVRRGLGFEAPLTGPDWYVLTILVLLAAAPILGIASIGTWYRRIWRRRLQQIWTTNSDIRRYSRIRSITTSASTKERDVRAAYVQALLATPAWSGHNIGANTESVGSADPDAAYKFLAEKMLKQIEEDVAERAITTGLVVGLGSSRIDRVTIISAALEMQLHVLTRLGKKPSMGTWREILKRTSASLFFNTYLNREDAFAVSFAIRRLAIGLDLGADLAQSTAESLGGDEMDSELVEEGVEALSGFTDLAGELADSIPFGGILKTSLGLSASLTQAVADLTREAGDELLQGALAGGVLYYHGMAIAADVLALDDDHRRSPAMTRTPLEGATRAAGVAGRLLRNQVNRYRGANRDRTVAPVRSLKEKFWPKKPTGGGEKELLALPAPDSAAIAPRNPIARSRQAWQRVRRKRSGGSEGVNHES
jgi:hypothetical protein